MITSLAAPPELIRVLDYIDDFDSLFPIVAAHVRTRYVLLATLGDEQDTKVDVLIDPTCPSRDAMTGWPCLTQGPA